MNKIGFKNFRKFQNFPVLELGDINILVGENNSGKSTFVKAAMLIMNFLKNAKALREGEMPKFFFSDVPHVNIDTFDRALCNYSKENSITFSVNLKEEFDTLFEIVIRRETEKGDRSYGYVENIICTFENEDMDEKKYVLFKIIFDFTKKLTVFESMEGENIYPIMLPLNCNTEKTDNLILSLFDDIISYDRDSNNVFDNKTKSSDFQRAFLSNDELELLTDSIYIVDMQRTSLAHSLTWPVEYIYAHGASQNPLFDTRNLNDISAKVVERFYKISGYKPVMDFVRKWLEEFGIGSNLSVECIEGTVYKVTIKKGTRKTNLGDLGMGSIQLVILIMHIAELVNQMGGFYDSSLDNETMVFIEEPEQNLHPALQSRLADFFLDVVRNYGGVFIIETHSEYLVRRSQVLVAEDNMDGEHKMSDNGFLNATHKRTYYKKANELFSVFYFGADGFRIMKYMKNGRFDQPFGSGFFDESGKSNIKLMQIERGIK